MLTANEPSQYIESNPKNMSETKPLQSEKKQVVKVL